MKNKNRASMVHCSFDTVTEFNPRVPKQRVEGMFTEDDKIKRICVAPTVQQALRGIPQSGMVMETMKKLKLPIIVHAYSINDRNATDDTISSFNWNFFAKLRPFSWYFTCFICAPIRNGSSFPFMSFNLLVRKSVTS